MLRFSMWPLVMVDPELGAQETPARQRDDRSERAAKPIRLRMTPAVACRAIDGYEQYEILPKAALTAEEKPLVYYRPLDDKTVQKDEFFKAHLTQDGQVRRRGEKAVLLRENEPGPPAIQSLEFRVVAPVLPEPSKEAK